MMTCSRVLAAAGMDDLDFVPGSLDSDRTSAAHSVRGTEATSCNLRSCSLLHLATPNDTEGGELHYQQEQKLRTNDVMVCMGMSMHPLELRQVARRKAHHILSMLQAHLEPLVSQEPSLINGIIHTCGQVQPLNELKCD
jgi:hypothetical protein